MNNLLQFLTELTGMTAGQVKLLGVMMLVLVVLVLFAVYMDERGGGGL